MLYIHHSSCISAQSANEDNISDTLVTSENNRLNAIEPKYEGIPNNILRRMGRAARISVGAAMNTLSQAQRLDGIIIGTSFGGMEDCIKFMEQIVRYHETDLTPGNFVQSTPNGLAAQIALLKQNRNYNATHSHRGLSFENALLDCAMLLKENPEHCYLLGGVDEISEYNYNVDSLSGWNKENTESNADTYHSATNGSIAGEGAAMFLVSAKKQRALAEVKAISTFQTSNTELLITRLKHFLESHALNGKIDLLLSGENGDVRLKKIYEQVEAATNAPVARFKHMSGEYGTASAQALWIAAHLLKTNTVPQHMIKARPAITPLNNILIYNNFKEAQHAFILISTC